jgi:hypothetical protein
MRLPRVLLLLLLLCAGTSLGLTQDTNSDDGGMLDEMGDIASWPTYLIVAFSAVVGGIVLTAVVLLLFCQWSCCCLPAPMASNGRARPQWLTLSKANSSELMTDGDFVIFCYVLVEVATLGCIIAALAINRQTWQEHTNGKCTAHAKRIPH